MSSTVMLERTDRNEKPRQDKLPSFSIDPRITVSLDYDLAVALVEHLEGDMPQNPALRAMVHKLQNEVGRYDND